MSMTKEDKKWHDKVSNNEYEGFALRFLVAPAALIALYFSASDPDSPLVLSTALTGTGLLLLFMFVECVCLATVATVLAPIRRDFFHDDVLCGRKAKVYSFVRFVVYLLVLSAMCFVAWQMFGDSWVTVEPEPETITLRVDEVDSDDLDHLLSVAKESADMEGYITISDNSGSYQLSTYDEIEVTFPYTVTVTKVVRYEDKLFTYSDSQTVYDDSSTYLEFQWQFDFLPDDIYVEESGGGSHPLTDPLDLQYLCTVSKA